MAFLAAAAVIAVAAAAELSSPKAPTPGEKIEAHLESGDGTRIRVIEITK